MPRASDRTKALPTVSKGLKRARTGVYRVGRRLHAKLWFPQVPLCLLFIAGAVWLFRHDLGPAWPGVMWAMLQGRTAATPKALPEMLIGGGMAIGGIGLLFRSRVAWTLALLLALAAVASTALGRIQYEYALLAYFALVLVVLVVSWRSFERSSLAASTVFALTSVAMLLVYATFGAFYLGAQFKPAITDLLTALYFAVVTMSTVGYGDITPQTGNAKLFTISVIVLGVAVFASSLTAVVGPLVNKGLKQIVGNRERRMDRSNHFVVVGATALAANTAQELKQRGRPVTRILRQALDPAEAGDADVVVGDPSNLAVLREAGADKAEAVLAMTADDSENAFVVLAVKELGAIRTIAAVNDAHHMDRLSLVQPDVIIAPQVLGGELTAMMLCGEQASPDFVMKRVFQTKPGAPKA